ncbi:MAG: hypothetical protein AAFQ14_12685 [Cyanobacteria bacterium J06621_12]
MLFAFKSIEIYRLEASQEAIPQPVTLTGDKLLPNLLVELDFIWE